MDIAGPLASETGTPNPFLDFRLHVDFTGPSGRTYKVPGFYAADGRAGETGADTGRIWRAYITPDLPGRRTYRVSFRAGDKVALADDASACTPAAGNGDTGEFTIGPTDKAGRDFRDRGRLAYVGEHHLRFAGTGEYFLKAGADSPENLLGYADFDGTSKSGGGSLKTWAPHVRDWREGDPTWSGGKGNGKLGWKDLVFESTSQPAFMPNSYPVFEPPYAFSLDSVKNVRALVTAGAGNVKGTTLTVVRGSGRVISHSTMGDPILAGRASVHRIDGRAIPPLILRVSTATPGLRPRP